MLKIWCTLCTITGSALVLYSLLFAVYPPARMWVVNPLLERDTPKKGADAILLLMGDIEDRTPVAAKLWKEGYAPKIIIVEAEKSELVKLGFKTAEGETTVRYLRWMGIPESAIDYYADGNASSTNEEAQYLLARMKALKSESHRGIVVTSWYHSSRAMWIFNRVNKNNWQLESFPSPTPEQWYAKENAFLATYKEYLKWPYYVARYGVF